MKKEKPEHQPVDASEVVGEARKAIEHFYDMKRTLKKGFKWQGPDITLSQLMVVRRSVAESLTAGQVQFDEKEQNRPPLELVLYNVFVLGIQNGILMEKKNSSRSELVADSYKQMYENVMKELEKLKKK